MINLTEEINGLDQALNKFIKTVKSASELSEADKLDINMAGAQVFEEALRRETRAKHYSNKKDSKFGHAADGIGMYYPRGLSKDSGVPIGSFIVGWKYHFHAMNMMRLNDGTKKLVGDNFITNLRHDSNVRSEMLKAEKSKYDELLKKKGDD